MSERKQSDPGRVAAMISDALDNLQHGVVFSLTVAFLVGCALFLAVLAVGGPWLALAAAGVVGGYPPSWLLGGVAALVSLVLLGHFWKRSTVNRTH